MHAHHQEKALTESLYEKNVELINEVDNAKKIQLAAEDNARKLQQSFEARWDEKVASEHQNFEVLLEKLREEELTRINEIEERRNRLWETRKSGTESEIQKRMTEVFEAQMAEVKAAHTKMIAEKNRDIQRERHRVDELNSWQKQTNLQLNKVNEQRRRLQLHLQMSVQSQIFLRHYRILLKYMTCKLYVDKWTFFKRLRGLHLRFTEIVEQIVSLKKQTEQAMLPASKLTKEREKEQAQRREERENRGHIRVGNRDGDNNGDRDREGKGERTSDSSTEKEKGKENDNEKEKNSDPLHNMTFVSGLLSKAHSKGKKKGLKEKEKKYAQILADRKAREGTIFPQSEIEIWKAKNEKLVAQRIIPADSDELFMHLNDMTTIWHCCMGAFTSRQLRLKETADSFVQRNSLLSYEIKNMQKSSQRMKHKQQEKSHRIVELEARVQEAVGMMEEYKTKAEAVSVSRVIHGLRREVAGRDQQIGTLRNELHILKQEKRLVARRIHHQKEEQYQRRRMHKSPSYQNIHPGNQSLHYNYYHTQPEQTPGEVAAGSSEGVVNENKGQIESGKDEAIKTDDDRSKKDANRDDSDGSSGQNDNAGGGDGGGEETVGGSDAEKYVDPLGDDTDEENKESSVSVDNMDSVERNIVLTIKAQKIEQKESTTAGARGDINNRRNDSTGSPRNPDKGSTKLPALSMSGASTARKAGRSKPTRHIRGAQTSRTFKKQQQHHHHNKHSHHQRQQHQQSPPSSHSGHKQPLPPSRHRHGETKHNKYTKYNKQKKHTPDHGSNTYNKHASSSRKKKKISPFSQPLRMPNQKIIHHHHHHHHYTAPPPTTGAPASTPASPSSSMLSSSGGSVSSLAASPRSRKMGPFIEPLIRGDEGRNNNSEHGKSGSNTSYRNDTDATKTRIKKKSRKKGKKKETVATATILESEANDASVMESETETSSTDNVITVTADPF